MNRTLALGALALLVAFAAGARASEPLEEAAQHPLRLVGGWKQGEAQGRFVVYVSISTDGVVTGRFFAPGEPFRGQFLQRAVRGSLTKGELKLTLEGDPQVLFSGAVEGDLVKGTRQIKGKAAGSFALKGLSNTPHQARLRLWLTNRLVWFAYLSGASKRVPNLIKALEAFGLPATCDTAARALAAAGEGERARVLAKKAQVETAAAVERLLSGESPQVVEGAPRGAEAQALRDQVWKAYLTKQRPEQKVMARSSLLAADPSTRDAFLALWALEGPCPLPDVRVRLLQSGFSPSAVEAFLNKQAATPKATPKPVTPEATPKPVTPSARRVRREAQPLAADVKTLPRREFVGAALPFQHLFLTSERPEGWLKAPWSKDYPRHLRGFDVHRYFRLPTEAALAKLPPLKGGALPPRPRPWRPAYTRFPAATPRTAGAVQKLTTQLRSRWAHERSKVVKALAKLGPPALRPLVSALSDAQDYVRSAAAEAIGRMGPAGVSATPALILRLGIEKPHEARAFVKAIGTLGPGALPHLEAAYAKGGKLRWRVVEAIGWMGVGAKPALPLLLRALSDGDASVRAAGAQALGRVGPAAKSATPSLIAALSDAQAAVQARALGAIRAIGPQAIAGRLEALRALLAVKDGDVRFEALLTAGSLGPRALSLADAMLAAFRKVESKRLPTAQAALAWVGPGIVQPLAAAIERDTNAYWRAKLCACLGLLGSRGATAVPVLVAGLDDPNGNARQAAIKALTALGKLAVPALLEILEARRPNGILAVEALRGMKLSVGSMAHPVVVELHAQSVASRQQALTNWLIARFRHAIAEPYLRQLPFRYETLRYGEYRLASGASVGGLTLRLHFEDADVFGFLDRKATISKLKITEQPQALQVSCQLSAKNLKGRKIYVRAQLGSVDRPSAVQVSKHLTVPYASTEWKDQKLSLPMAKVRAAFGAKNPNMLLVVSCHDAASGEMLAWKRGAFGLSTKARYSFHELRKIRVDACGGKGRERLVVRLNAWASDMQGKRLSFRATLYDFEGRALPGGMRTVSKVGARYTTEGIAIAYPRAFLKQRLAGRRRPSYVGISMLAGSPPQILEFDIVPFVYGPTPPVTALLSGFLIEAQGCHALLGTGLGGHRSFWKLSAPDRQAALKNHGAMVNGLVTLASRARLELPPLRPEWVKLLLAKKTWSYRSGWSHNSSSGEFSAVSARKIGWTFHADRSCQYTSNWNFFTNSTTRNTPSSAGSLYRPGMPSGTIVSTAHASLGDRKEGGRAPFDVRGEPTGPWWIVRYDPAGTTSIHPFAPKKRGRFGISTYEAMEIDGVIEGKYESGNRYKFREGPGNLPD
jgi:HEAT repeat protein